MYFDFVYGQGWMHEIKPTANIRGGILIHIDQALPFPNWIVINTA